MKTLHDVKDVIAHFTMDEYDHAEQREAAYESIKNYQCMKCHRNLLYIPDKRGAMLAHRSLGSCTSCHTRHRFSLMEARKPEACGQCHGNKWVNDHYIKLDQAIGEYNTVYYAPAKALLDELYEKGLLDKTRAGLPVSRSKR